MRSKFSEPLGGYPYPPVDALSAWLPRSLTPWSCHGDIREHQSLSDTPPRAFPGNSAKHELHSITQNRGKKGGDQRLCTDVLFPDQTAWPGSAAAIKIQWEKGRKSTQSMVQFCHSSSIPTK